MSAGILRKVRENGMNVQVTAPRGMNATLIPVIL